MGIESMVFSLPSPSIRDERLIVYFPRRGGSIVEVRYFFQCSQCDPEIQEK